MVLSFMIPFSASRKSRIYDPIPAPDEETFLGSAESTGIPILPSCKHSFFDPSHWLTAFAILSIAFTIRNLFVIQLHSQQLHVSYLEASVGSPYTGLEKLVRNTSSPSWPLSSTHYPDFIAATEGPTVHHALTNGSVVRLDSERTVILQHRVRDYSLEHCTVKVEFSHKASGKTHEHAARAYGSIGENPHLRLWRLEDPAGGASVLASSALPMRVPSRKEFLGNITLDGTRPVQSPSFACRAGSVQTLEIALACTSDPCIMEFRLTRSPRRQGLWVLQSEEGSAIPV